MSLKGKVAIVTAGAMGIVVGYFLPADDTAMAALRRKGKPAARQVAAAHSM